MGIIRWLRSFSPDLCAMQMHNLTFTFADNLENKARDYGLHDRFSFASAVTIAAYSVCEAYGRSTLPEREVLALGEYLKSIKFHLYSLHKAGKIGPREVHSERFIDWCENHFREKFSTFDKAGNLNDAIAPGAHEDLLTIVANVLEHTDAEELENSGRFLMLASLFYGDFFKICKIRVG